MEDTLRETEEHSFIESRLSLNPCFNGRYSQSYSRISRNYFGCVLILVLMEDTLRAPSSLALVKASTVLILVLMEDTLRVTILTRTRKITMS